jgi:dihydroorotate dehydrogenase (NAD+) catalytic subunit
MRMNTPLIAVSGIYGLDYENLGTSRDYIGAVVTKSVTLNPRSGNLEPRTVETRAGLLNAIGLQNPGIEVFIKDDLPKLRILEVPVIASVAGSNIEEYVKCSEMLSDRDEIHAIELNVSCPNVERGGIEFGCDINVLGRLVSEVRPVVRGKILIVKLTPNVTDIASLAQAAIDGGANVISLINTLRGMAIDLVTQKPKLGNVTGGLSGIGIHPVAVYMVHQSFTACCRRNGIPIIGIGGVSNADEALELILAGATCVGVGTAMFRDQTVFEKISKGIQTYLSDGGQQSVTSIIGLAATTDFRKVANYLNISETTAKSLADRKLMPGRSTGGEWDFNQDEIEKWYINFNAQDWANLVSAGKINRIFAELTLEKDVSSERLVKVIKEWKKNGTLGVTKTFAESSGRIVAKVKIKELGQIDSPDPKSVGKFSTNLSEKRKGLLKSLQYVNTAISMVAKCKLILASETVIITLLPNGVLHLETQNDFKELSQRERDIIGFYLGMYAQRLALETNQSL